MKPEDAIICLCARQRFEDAHRQSLEASCRGSTLDWDYLFETTNRRNQIAPLVYQNLSPSRVPGLPIPAATLERFKQATIRNIMVKRHTADALATALDLFARKGIPVMLVKGAALNLTVYEKPWYTVSHDVDLVIRPRREELDASDLRDITETLDALNEAPRELRELIEYDFYAHHDVTMNDVVAIDPERLWREARKHRVGEHEVLLMTPEDSLLATAVQCCRKRFFKLKNLVDLSESAAGYADLDWDVAIDKAHAYRCNVQLYAALVVSELVLGSPYPTGTLARLKVSPVRARLIRRISADLLRKHSLAELRAVSGKAFLGRPYSTTLSLTYATYRLDQLAPKMDEIRRGFARQKEPAAV